jgi:NADH-quinone oxidoreductase subunit N
MPGSFAPHLPDILRVLPELVLIVFGTLIMVLEPLTANGNKRRLGYLGLAGLTLALGAVAVSHLNPGTAFRDMILVDGFSTFFRALVIAAGMLTVLNSIDYFHRERRESGEYYALLLFSITGQCLMVASRELIMIFIGLEISSIASYVMAGYLRRDPRNNEAAIKYFLLGAFASAFLLYGIAWIFGGTGSTDLVAIRVAIEEASTRPPIFVLATSAALMFTGFAFKVSAAPFHVWAADVYQGAPAPVAAFLSAGPKAAAFAVIVRVYMTAFAAVGFAWIPILWMVALCTMIIGNFCAITQRNIKRLLAYSSIAHAGYVMVAVSAASSAGVRAVMFYLAAYAFMNLGAFAVVIWFARGSERFLEVNQFAGLSKRQPAVAALFTIFLLSLIGIPLTGGFFGKFYIFQAAVESGLYSLTILGLLNSAVAAYYYLRILVVMYFHEPDAHAEPLPDVPAGIRATLWISATATILLGVYPSLILQLADATPILSP